MKTIEILCGIPCSGKSTYVSRFANQYWISTVSRDEIRLWMYGPRYKMSNFREKLITEEFDRCLHNCLVERVVDTVILDNTHCREKYINEIIRRYPHYKIIVTFFDIPLSKAHYRNIIRYFKTGKWIPISVINNMKKSYDKINKTKYEKYA